MIKVQEATYTPGINGGEMRASIRAGSHEISTTWPLDDDQSLKPLLNQVLARIDHMTFLQTDEGIEIRAGLTIAGRSFVSRLPVDSDDQYLRPVIDRLMEKIGADFVQTIQMIPQAEHA